MATEVFTDMVEVIRCTEYSTVLVAHAGPGLIVMPNLGAFSVTAPYKGLVIFISRHCFKLFSDAHHRLLFPNHLTLPTHSYLSADATFIITVAFDE